MSRLLKARPKVGSSISKIMFKRKHSVAGSEDSILDIEGHVVLPRSNTRPTVDRFRDDGYLHVSDLIHRCLRAVALSKRTGTKIINEPIYSNLGLTFAIGHAISDYLIDKVKEASPEQLYGCWSCACKSSRYEGVYKQSYDTMCKVCNTKIDRYNELSIINTEYGISGSIDLVLLIDKVFYLSEVKSINKEDWESLERPLPNHLLQILFYYWLAKEAKMKVHNQVSVVYANKAHTRSNPFKEFTIKASDHLDRLTPYLEAAKELKVAVENDKNKLPKRVCTTSSSTLAKTCSLCAICFSMEG